MDLLRPSKVVFGRFTTVTEVLAWLGLYAQPGADPYVPSHVWGSGEDEKTRFDFVTEIIRGETALSIEGVKPIKFVRDVGSTVTARVTCLPDPSKPPLFLQEYKKRADGSSKKRRHRHSSISEKLIEEELKALGIDLNERWIEWWDEYVCVEYAAGRLPHELLNAILNIVTRLIWEELQLVVSREDIGPDRLKFVPIRVWAHQDSILRNLKSDGTTQSMSFPGMWTRNRLLCMYWNMPVMSSLGHQLFNLGGYEEREKRNMTRWIAGHTNE